MSGTPYRKAFDGAKEHVYALGRYYISHAADLKKNQAGNDPVVSALKTEVKELRKFLVKRSDLAKT